MNYVNVLKRRCTESSLLNKLYDQALDSHAGSHPYKDGQALPNSINISNREAGILYYNY